MFHPGRDIDSEAILMKGHWWRGRVVSRADETKNRRIKVRLPQIHWSYEDDQLPWFTPITSNSGVGNNGKTGTFDPLPTVGSWVWVQFMDESHYHGIYIGGAHLTPTQLTDFKGEDHEHLYGYVDEAGTLHIVNTKLCTYRHQYASGTSLLVDGKGRVKVTVADNAVGDDALEQHEKGIEFHVQGGAKIFCTEDAAVFAGGKGSLVAGGDIDVSAQGNAAISASGNAKISAGGNADVNCGGSGSFQAGGQLTLSGSQIKLNPGGGGSPTSPTAVTAPATPAALTRPAEVDYADKKDD